MEPQKPLDTPLDNLSSHARLALKLVDVLNRSGEITSKILTQEANQAFGGTQAEGAYSFKDAYDAMESAFNLHLRHTESSDWVNYDLEKAKLHVLELTDRVKRLPTQTKRDDEMDEFQQFSTPPTLSFVANWVANVKSHDVFVEPSAGTGDLAIWADLAGAKVVLNELSERRSKLLETVFPNAQLFKENAEHLDNVLPAQIAPTVIVMNPPFSSTAGRVRGQRDSMNGAKHVEQALRRLQDGGRLVAIVGNGMANDRSAFAGWWNKIKSEYNVKANIGISGKEYAKFGTTFDNQILVIDKTGATLKPVLTANVESVADLPYLLEGIRNERSSIKSALTQSTSGENTRTRENPVQPTNTIGDVSDDSGESIPKSLGDDGDVGANDDNGKAGEVSEIGDDVYDGIGARNRNGDEFANGFSGSVGDVIGGNSHNIESDGGRFLEEPLAADEKIEFTDSVFAHYKPQRLSIAGAAAHPGKLVQSAAMSAVNPPEVNYKPVLPSNVVRDGLLSIAQLEALVYAGQAHSELLANGSRRGFFIGDGTGVGKGREISGIILDNLMQGRKKAVWVSFNEGLIDSARRDYAGIGGDQNQIFFQGKTKAGGEITQAEGILFTTYSTLRGGEKKLANDRGQTAGKTRAEQIVEWLGKDFDGVIAFDEAHSMGNAIAVKAKRGARKPSQQALAGINLQRELPNARVVYVSATGATEISNLSYADRLGLWGEGTPFADTSAFIQNVSKGGIASMELISRDMKAMGMYLARSLSYDGVSYERLEHQLSPLQVDIYNELAGAWQLVLNNVDQALEITQAGRSGSGKSAALSQFWGTHQRFFNQVITSLQTPMVIDDIRKHLDNGNVAVIQLVNTNEAAQERIIAEATANGDELEALDFTPRQMLMDYVKNGFPVALYQETRDANGNVVYEPVRDSSGNQVFDKKAIALRDALLENLRQIRVPENPIDSIINAFGVETVAEITGRGRRFVQGRDDEGNFRVYEEKRNKNSSRSDAEAFQDGRKKILIFSGAGGTGYSFHADNTAKNQSKRIHYILQPGWRADSAVQGFGRTHRTNQAQEPHYVLPTTNLKAQKRFVSSIARRLDQLGALTRGQRQATSQGMFTAADNLESEYAKTALYNFFIDLYRGKTPLSFQEISKQMGLNLIDENGALSETKIPEIPQFLNRLLSLKTDAQNAVFDEFEQRLVESVEYAKERGLYDEGLQTVIAESIVKTRDEVAYEDLKTSAQTRYVELDITNTIEYQPWSEIKSIANRSLAQGGLSGWFVSENGKDKGEVFFMGDLGWRLDSDGRSVSRGIIHKIKKQGHKYIDNAEAIDRGWEHRIIAGRYEKVVLSRKITEAEAEKLWAVQLENAPKTETKKQRMLVGVILPIWDRVEGAETIVRLQTDEGEQLLGRMLGQKAANQTLKNLGLGSGVSNLSVEAQIEAIEKGGKALLANGWVILSVKVNNEMRLEIKPRSSFTDAERLVLIEQGAFSERIGWEYRVFIPKGQTNVAAFKRITDSKPIVELVGVNETQIAEHGIPNQNVFDSGEKAPVSQVRTPPSELTDDDHIKSAVDSADRLGLVGKDRQEHIVSEMAFSFGMTKDEVVNDPAVQKALKVSPSLQAKEKAIDRIVEGVKRQAIIANQQMEDDGLIINATDTEGLAENSELQINSKPNQNVLDSGEKTPFSQVFTSPIVLSEQSKSSVTNQSKLRTGVVMEKKPFHEVVAENLINQLKQGVAPWQKPWSAGEPHYFMPSNPVTGNRYKGINAIHLIAQGHQDQRWMTYNQAKDAGAQVRKGERGTMIQYWKFTEEQVKRDENGKPMLDEEGNSIKQVVKLERPRTFISTVFNAEQIDGLPELERKQEDWNSVERAEAILKGSGAIILHDQSDRAFYRQGSDSIHLPPKSQFSTPEGYYSTALHELGHWTGHTSRLARDLSNPFGSEGYAKEELRAEIASLILSNELGVGHEPGQHVAYVQSWIKVLEDDPLEIFRAAADAEKIQGFVMGLENKQVEEVDLYNRIADMSKTAFLQIATVSELVNHGRKFEVFVGDQSLGYSDASNEFEAMVDIHRGIINNALYSRTDDNKGSLSPLPERPFPSERAIDSYPDLKVKFAELFPQSVNQGYMLNQVSVVNGEIVSEITLDNPIAVGLYEKLSDGTKQSIADYQLSATEQVTGIVERLNSGELTIVEAIQILDEHSFTDEHMQAAIDTNLLANQSLDEYRKLAENARREEELIRSNPDSNLEEIANARELRKSLELNLTLAEIEQKKIVENQQVKYAKNQDKSFLAVPFKEKEEAKSLGAKWDREAQSWYIPTGVDTAPFKKWQSVASGEKSEPDHQQPLNKRQYLAVPYSDREKAKSAGAKWDKGAKSWYVNADAVSDKVKAWLPDAVQNQPLPAITPREEFAEALRAVGCVVGGEHPIMDGRSHRIATIGDKSGEKAGFYVGHLDGHPAGHIQNNRTGDVLKWKSKGYALSAEEKAKLQAEAADKIQQRELHQKSVQLKVAESVNRLLSVAPLATEDHPYLVSKSARANHLKMVPDSAIGLEDSNVMIGATWKESNALREANPDKLVFTAGDLLVPAQNIQGEIQTVQTIQPSGSKRFVTGGQKQESFIVVGGDGLSSLVSVPAIVIAEGYATADTLSKALGYATVAAFDSGNLPSVTKAIHDLYPSKTFVIAGDNDVHQELLEGRNPGREKALAAAKLVDADVVWPIFAPNEQSYPNDLKPVTPEDNRAGLLTGQQLEAIAAMKKFTDFNDLETKSTLGIDGVKRQVSIAVKKALESNVSRQKVEQEIKRPPLSNQRSQSFKRSKSA